MASIVSDIISGIRTVASGQLGGSWQELRNWYEVDKNDIRSAALAYNVRPLSAIPVDGVMKYYTVDQTFEIILSDVIARGHGDSERETALLELYNKADEIFKDLHNTKVNGTSGVLLVSQPSLAEPEFLDEKKIIVLRMQFVVKYRGSTL